MNENEVKTAFDRIEPESGAQERMYANILKKAAAQKAAAPEEKTDAPAAENDASATVVSLPVRRPTPMWKRCSAMAACLALAVTVTLGFLSPFLSRDSEANEPPVMGSSPFEDVQSAEEFEALGFSIDAPEGAEDVAYCIYDGAIASLQRFKDSVKEVAAGYECGITFEKFQDIKEGDIVEAFLMEQIEV